MDNFIFMLTLCKDIQGYFCSS